MSTLPQIYLDHHATTPCDARVLEAMLPYFSDHFGNAASTHAWGNRAYDAVENARDNVADLLGAQPSEIIWTSGATEANNLALLGIARGTYAQLLQPHRRRILTSALEHKSVLQPLRALEKEGFQVEFLPVDNQGRIEIEALRAALNDHVLLLSIQAANGEIGTIQLLQEITELARTQGVLVHCDASQAIGKIPFNVENTEVDLVSFSAHKIYGPKGVGALWIRRGLSTHIAPLTYGGSQERGLRPGTLPIPLVVGAGAACQICDSEIEVESARLEILRDEFELRLRELYPKVRFNGAVEHRLSHNSSATFHGLPADVLLAHLPNLALSTGAACDSGAPEPSKTLQVIGFSRADAVSTIRVGLGRNTTQEEVEIATTQIANAAFDLQAHTA